MSFVITHYPLYDGSTTPTGPNSEMKLISFSYGGDQQQPFQIKSRWVALHIDRPHTLHKLVGRPGGAFERLSSSSSTSVRHLTSCAWWLGFLIGVGVNAVTSSTKGYGACFQLQIVALMYMYRTMYIRRFLYKGPRGR